MAGAVVRWDGDVDPNWTTSGDLRPGVTEGNLLTLHSVGFTHGLEIDAAAPIGLIDSADDLETQPHIRPYSRLWLLHFDPVAEQETRAEGFVEFVFHLPIRAIIARDATMAGDRFEGFENADYWSAGTGRYDVSAGLAGRGLELDGSDWLRVDPTTPTRLRFSLSESTGIDQFYIVTAPTPPSVGLILCATASARRRR